MKHEFGCKTHRAPLARPPDQRLHPSRLWRTICAIFSTCKEGRLVTSRVTLQSRTALEREGTIMAECPECGATIQSDGIYEEGEIIDCGDCGVELEVISDDPFELALAPEEEEDWGE